MTETNVQNNHKVIRKKDSTFPAHLDFELLRKRGIDHIGELSGKIWTDHNQHDPGITILEVLCYALLDLGYRTKLPIEDLLALNHGKEQIEDNFFTPAQILTGNPTSVLDYRKMLIDIPGVRNAWLSPATDESVTVTLDKEEKESIECKLNGLYKVQVQLDRSDPFCSDGNRFHEMEGSIVQETRKRLMAHRNLCEDFLSSIEVLEEVNVGINANIEIAEGVDPDQVYIEILQALQRFLSPEVNFYTLKQMLDKGRSIEDIFAGRPFSEESYGFIDTEELAALELPQRIYFSDVYRVMLEVQGVRSVTSLSINGENDKRCYHYALGGKVPVFCFDRSQLCLYHGASFYRFSADRTRYLYKRALLNKQKTRYRQNGALDHPVPNGTFRADLASYRSIQDDMPRVYGIGQEGLPEDVGEARQAQALQLKAYMLFYDQLLAEYLNQLAHLRDLFSLKEEDQRSESARHTYYAPKLDTIPQVEDLIRFYDNKYHNKYWIENSVLAIPALRSEVELRLPELLQVKDQEELLRLIETPFSSAYLRNNTIAQFLRDFQHRIYDIQVLEGDCGYLFMIKSPRNSYILVGKELYANAKEARRTAEAVVFLATLDKAYRSWSDLFAGQYYFSLVYHPIDYVHYLQALKEDRKHYYQRRNDFLDHLLARFGEGFTDYSLLLYKQAANQNEKHELNAKNKANLLSQYDDLSRNRGRAFNYSERSWNTDNVSGLEKKVGALAGIHDFKRKDLCQFEVVEYKPKAKIAIKDKRDKVLFHSKVQYSSKEEAKLALSDFLRGLKDAPLDAVQHFFREAPLQEEIAVSREKVRLELVNPHTGSLRYSRKRFTDEEEAKKEIKAFVKNINKQMLIQSGTTRRSAAKIRLIPLPDQQNTFLDTAALHQYFHLADPHFRWQLWDEKGELLLESTTTHADEQAALQAFAECLTWSTKDLKVEKGKSRNTHELVLRKKKGRPLAIRSFNTKEAFTSAKKKVQTYLEKETEKGHFLSSFTSAYCWQVKEKDKLLLESVSLFPNKRMAEKGWRDLSDRAKQSKAFVFKDLPNDSIQVELRGVDGAILANSPVLREGTKESIRTRLQSLFGIKKHMSTPKVNKAYGFQLPNPADARKAFLVSYYLFRSPSEALFALREALPLVSQTKAYFSSGDDANLNYGFSIWDTQGRFVARHPGTYGTTTERDGIKKELRKHARQLQLPFQFIKKNHYQFLTATGKVLLQSTAEFDDPKRAEVAFDTLLKLLVNPAVVQDIVWKDKAAYFLEVKEEGKRVAAPLAPFQHLKERDDLRYQLQEIMQENQYTVLYRRYPFRWKFRFQWEKVDGHTKWLLESVDLSTQAKAEKGFADFLQHLGDVQLEPVQKGKSSYGIHFTYGGKVFAHHPITYTNADERDTVKQDIQDLFAFVEDLKANPEENERLLEQWVEVPMESLENKWQYRIFRKDQPLAFHRVPTGATKLHPSFFMSIMGQLADYFYPDVLLSGDIIREVDEKFYYEIKVRQKIELGTEQAVELGAQIGPYRYLTHFVSFQSYYTEAAAREAFQEHYVKIIDQASDPLTYCDDPNNELVPANQTPICTISLTERHADIEATCPERFAPWVVVPEEVYQSFYEDESNAGKKLEEEWAKLFRSYPVRPLKEEKSIKIPNDGNTIEKIETRYDDRYFFRLIYSKPQRELLRSVAIYETIEEAWTDFYLLLHLLANPSLHFRSDYRDESGHLFCRSQDCLPAYEKHQCVKPISLHPCEHTTSGGKIVYGDTYYTITEVLAESTESQECPAEAASGTKVIKPALSVGARVFDDEDEAWGFQGLSRCLIAACGPDGFQRFQDTCEPDTGYSFHIVDQNYRLAHHPQFYDKYGDRATGPHWEEAQRSTLPVAKTIDSLEKAKTTLRAMSCDPDYREQIINISVCSAFKFTIEDILHGKTWTSDSTYENQREAWDTALRTLEYIRRGNVGYTSDGGQQGIEVFRLGISEFGLAKDEVILLWPEDGTIDAGDLSNDELGDKEKLQLAAMHYPIFIGEQGYGFQLYNPDFGLINPAPTGATSPLMDEADDHHFIPPGMIIWESVRQYRDREEAEKYYAIFCTLINDVGNYKIIGDPSCGPFSLELLNPSEILATHPQRYTSIPEAEAAIDRTKASVNREGFHLLEHILFRSEEHLVIPNKPDKNCRIPLSLPKSDPIEPTTDNSVQVSARNPNTLTDDAAKDKDVYIPGVDFYSFWVSLVLPQWPCRFQEHDFQQYLQELFYREAPAHVGLKIHWLSPKDMCAFEACYRSWLCDRLKKSAPQLIMECTHHEVANCSDLFSTLPGFSMEIEDPLDTPCDNQRVSLPNVVLTQLLAGQENTSLAQALPGIQLGIQGNTGCISRKRKQEQDISKQPGLEDLKKDKDQKVVDVKREEETPSKIKAEAPRTQPASRKKRPPAIKDKPRIAPSPKSNNRTFRKNIRGRMKRYQDVLENLGPASLKRSRSYKATQKLVTQKQGFADYEQIVLHLLLPDIRNKPKTRQGYERLLELATWYILDKLIGDHKYELQHEAQLKEIVATMKELDIDRKALAQGWQAAGLVEGTDISIMKDYIKIIIS